MKNKEARKVKNCTMGRVWKVLAVIILLVQEAIYLQAAVQAAGINGTLLWGVILQMLLGLVWPAMLWSMGEVLDRQEAQEQKLERILELLGEKPEEDLTQLEARLEEALETGEEPEFETEDE